MDKFELDVERLPHEKMQIRTSLFLVDRALFSNFAEGFARITFKLTEHSPDKITSLKV